MATGRKRLPSTLKVVRGTERRDRANPAEPKPDRGVPKIPADLAGKARETWKVVGPVLDRMGVLTQADATALQLLCEAYADYREAAETLRVAGTTYATTTQQGDTMYRPRPEVAIRNDAWRRVVQMLAEFGLTPSSRSKVSVIEAGAQDEERFFGT